SVYLVFDLLLLACALFGLRLDLVYAFQRVAIPYQLDYDEGILLEGAQRILNGTGLYLDPHRFPNAIDSYPPLASYAIALLVKLGGLEFLWPRMLVVASVLAIGLLIAFVIARETGVADRNAPATRWFVAAAFGAMFVSI